MHTNIQFKSQDAKNRLQNLKTFLKDRYDFRYDEISNNVEIKPKTSKNWQQLAENDLWEEINSNHENTGMDYICHLVGSRKFTPSFNPIETWLESLSINDSKLPFSLEEYDPFEQLCSFIELEDKADKYRLYYALKKWFVSSIKCLLEDYVAKQVLVFEGPTGIGKTPFFEAILPGPLSKKYLKILQDINSKNKDSRLSLTSNFVIILDEIDDFLKNKDNRQCVKSYVSQKIVRERLPYGKSEVSRNRICSFLGTCNESTFLNDPTGTQRFVVFSVKNFINRKYYKLEETDFPVVENFPIEQCWAHAYRLYKEGFEAEYTSCELEENEVHNEKYKYNSPEFETLFEYLAPAKKEEEGAVFLTSTAICNFLNSQQTDIVFKINPTSKVLKRLKFERIGYKSRYGYFVKKLKG